MKELNKLALYDLRRIIMDENITKDFTIDGNQKAKYIEVQNDGSIVLGASSCRLLNRLWRGEVILSVSDLCIKLIQAIANKFSNSKKELSSSMFEEVTTAINRKDFSQAISRLFIAYRILYCNDLEDMFDGSDCQTRSKQSKEENIIINGVLLKDSSGKKVILGSDGIFRNVIF